MPLKLYKLGKKLYDNTNVIIMKTSEKVRIRIDEFEKGFVFTYDDFDIEMNESEALKKYLNRLVESNKIKRLSKGRF